MNLIFALILGILWFDNNPGRIGVMNAESSLASFNSARSGESGTADESAQQNQPKRSPSPIGGFFSGIRTLPLGAKIGLTVVFTWFAWWIVTLSFISFLADRRVYLRSIGLSLLGLSLWLLPGVMWW